MDLSMLRDVCRRYSGCAREYFVEPIPAKKVNNARVSLNIPPSEEIIALIDFTVLGGAKDAMVVTESGLYWKTVMESPRVLSWEQLRQHAPRETMFSAHKYIEFGDGLAMSVSCAPTFMQEENHVLSQLLNDLRAISQGVVPDGQASERWIGRIGCLMFSRSSRRCPLQVVSSVSDKMQYVTSELLPLPSSIIRPNLVRRSDFLAPLHLIAKSWTSCPNFDQCTNERRLLLKNVVSGGARPEGRNQLPSVFCILVQHCLRIHRIRYALTL